VTLAQLSQFFAFMHTLAERIAQRPLHATSRATDRSSCN